MPSSASNIPFAYGPDEGYVGPSDEEASDGTSFEEEAVDKQDQKGAGAEEGPTLSKYRQSWCEAVGYRRGDGVTEIMVQDTARDVFSTVELLHLVLRQVPASQLPPLALLNSYFRQHVHSLAFECLTLSSLDRIRQLLETPSVLAHLRDLTLYGWDARESAFYSEVASRARVSQSAAASGADCVDHGNGFFDEEPSLPFPFRRSHSLPDLTPANVDDIEAMLHSQLSCCPFTATPSPSISPQSFATLFSSLTSLTLRTPLSHLLPRLSNALSEADYLQHLTICGGPAVVLPTLKRNGGVSIPAAVVWVRNDGCGLAGSPSALSQLKLIQLQLAQPPMPFVGPDTSLPAPALERLCLEEVVVTRPAGLRMVQQDDGELRDNESDTDESDDEDDLPKQEQNPPLSLDLSLFVGTPSRLTHLTLRAVSGIIPSSVIEVIRQSGSRLQLLDLADLNLPPRPRFPRSTRADRLSLFHNFFAPPHQQDESTFRRLAALSSSSSVTSCSSHARLPSSADLASALSSCTSLRVLRLESACNTSSNSNGNTNSTLNSPFFPSIVDALLSARPPLRVLRWSVGIPPSSATAGSAGMDWKEWKEFAEKVKEVEGWGTLGAKDIKADQQTSVSSAWGGRQEGSETGVSIVHKFHFA